MYHMYPWDRSAERPGTTTRAGALAAPGHRAAGRAPEAAVRAVQVALDRRDNGAPAPRGHQ